MGGKARMGGKAKLDMGVHRAVVATSIVGLLLASLWPIAAGAEELPCLKAASVAAGDTFTLTVPIEGTATVRLAGILAPLSPANASANAALPLATAARDALLALLGDDCLRLVPDAPLIDRYNRLSAQIFRHDGVWIQGELVHQGLARVVPGLDTGENIRRLLPLEADARAAARGLWADEAYAVRTDATAGRFIGTFQLVEGTVRKAARVGPNVYLNFGDDWRSDFTVVIPAKTLAAWARAGSDPMHLGGRRVRVRGVIESLNGAMIEAAEPEMLEVLP